MRNIPTTSRETYICAHNRGLFEGDKLQFGAASLSFREHRHIAQGSLSLGDLNFKVKGRFQIRLVEARESSSCITRLELSTQHVVEVVFLGSVRRYLSGGFVLGTVETAHGIVHGTGEVDR